MLSLFVSLHILNKVSCSSLLSDAFLFVSNCVQMLLSNNLYFFPRELEPQQRESREGPVRYMGRGGSRPVYDRERTERGGLRRRDGADRVPRFREFVRPRSPK